MRNWFLPFAIHLCICSIPVIKNCYCPELDSPIMSRNVPYSYKKQLYRWLFFTFPFVFNLTVNNPSFPKLLRLIEFSHSLLSVVILYIYDEAILFCHILHYLLGSPDLLACILPPSGKHQRELEIYSVMKLKICD